MFAADLYTLDGRMFHVRIMAQRTHRLWLWLARIAAGLVAVVVGLSLPPIVAGFIEGGGGTIPVLWRHSDMVSRPLGLLVVILTVTLGVFYKGAVDPDLMIRRTTVYSAVTIVFVFLFAGFEEVVSEQLGRIIAGPRIVGAIVTGGFAALLVAPFHGWLTRLAKRILPESGGADQPDREAIGREPASDQILNTRL